jgi:RNA polymerase sigma factor (sigma-70 family)
LSTDVLNIHWDLIEQSKTGDSRSQQQLYMQYAKAMYNICRRMINNETEAEDVLQDAFSDAFYRLNSFRYESTFGAWLKRIVVNHCINHLKKRKAELVPIGDFSFVDIDSGVEEIQDDEEAKLSVTRILKASELLPDGYRVIFSLYLLEGYDHAEISEILGITESTSKSQFLRAKQKIRELLNQL